MIDAGDPAPVTCCNPHGRSPFLLVGDHAGNAIPRALGTLGLAAADRNRHIAWDIGVRGLGEMLAEALDACFIHQAYSRLVIDCNRDPLSAEAMLTHSDGSRVPANAHIPPDQRAARIDAVHTPYHDRIAAELGARAAVGRPTVGVALHSFTPSMAGIRRPWDIGVLHAGGEARVATALLALLAREATLCVGDNQPYRMDETDYTIQRHAIGNGLAYVELEVRQDVISGEEGQRAWCARLATALAAALIFANAA